MIQIMPHMREENTYHFTCSTYDESEGVQGKVFNRNSVCRTEKGDFIFGGTSGLTIFNPLTIKYNHNIPEVVITDFTCINSDTCRMESAISYVDALELNYNQRNFSLTLSASNYFLPHKNKFSYKL